VCNSFTRTFILYNTYSFVSSFLAIEIIPHTKNKVTERGPIFCMQLHHIYKKTRYFYLVCVDSKIYSTVLAISFIATRRSFCCPDSWRHIGRRLSVSVQRQRLISAQYQRLILIFAMLQLDPVKEGIDFCSFFFPKVLPLAKHVEV